VYRMPLPRRERSFGAFRRLTRNHFNFTETTSSRISWREGQKSRL
jgi:hypothetical protein